MGSCLAACNGLEFPTYFDANYGCQMEVLRFESASPNPRFEGWIDQLQNYLVTAQTISSFNASLLNLQLAVDA